MSWFSGFENVVRTEVPLRDLTWVRLGGPARWFGEPRDEDQLAALLARARDNDIPWHILGGGTNVIVRDAGFDGLVIHLVGPVFERIEFDDDHVQVGAGADLPRVVSTALKRDLVGLEILAGIPGSIGGAVRMNAGGRHGEIGQFVRDVRVLDSGGTLVTRAADQVGFAYRHTNLGNCVVLGATLKLERGDGQLARERCRAILAERQHRQPPAAARSAGCVFKNPPQQPAGRLLDAAGLKGVRVGGAEISTRHANFILARDDATADDVLNLIQLARDRVRETSGIELEPEVEIW
jgi:UDP-N-acetylmuramate dehydrogenase